MLNCIAFLVFDILKIENCECILLKIVFLEYGKKHFKPKVKNFFKKNWDKRISEYRNQMENVKLFNGFYNCKNFLCFLSKVKSKLDLKNEEIHKYKLILR